MPGSKERLPPNHAAPTRSHALAWAHDNGERVHVSRLPRDHTPQAAQPESDAMRRHGRMTPEVAHASPMPGKRVSANQLAMVGAPACPYPPGTQLPPKQARLPGSKERLPRNNAALTHSHAPAWAHDHGERAHVSQLSWHCITQTPQRKLDAMRQRRHMTPKVAHTRRTLARLTSGRASTEASAMQKIGASREALPAKKRNWCER